MSLTFSRDGASTCLQTNLGSTASIRINLQQSSTPLRSFQHVKYHRFNNTPTTIFTAGYTNYKKGSKYLPSKLRPYHVVAKNDNEIVMDQEYMPLGISNRIQQALKAGKTSTVSHPWCWFEGRDRGTYLGISKVPRMRQNIPCIKSSKILREGGSKMTCSMQQANL